MTYDPVDADDDGTVESDVDNTNTTTQTLDTGDLGIDPYGRAAQIAADRKVVPIYNGGGIGDAIDVADSATPVQDAIDDVKSNGQDFGGTAGTGGAVLLPQANVSEAASLSNFGGVRIQGMGVNATAIAFETDTAHGLEITQGSDAEQAYIDGLTIDGGGSARTSGSGMHFDGAAPTSFNMGVVQFKNWDADPVINMVNGAQPFRSTWEHIRMFGCDADGWFMGSACAGTANWCGMLAANLDPGNGNQLFDWRGIGREQYFGNVLLFNCRLMGQILQTQGMVTIEQIHHEMDSDPASAEPYLLKLAEDGPVQIGNYRPQNHTFDYIYRLGNAVGNKEIGIPELRSSDQPEQAVIEVNSQPSAECRIAVPISEIDLPFSAVQGNELIWSTVDQDWADPLGHRDNPEVVDLAGGSVAYSAGGRVKPQYHIQLENSGGSLGSLQAVDGISPVWQGVNLTIVGKNLSSNAEIVHNSGSGSSNFQTSDGTNITLSAANDFARFIWSGGSWRECFRNV